MIVEISNFSIFEEKEATKSYKKNFSKKIFLFDSMNFSLGRNLQKIQFEKVTNKEKNNLNSILIHRYNANNFTC